MQRRLVLVQHLSQAAAAGWSPLSELRGPAGAAAARWHSQLVQQPDPSKEDFVYEAPFRTAVRRVKVQGGSAPPPARPRPARRYTGSDSVFATSALLAAPV